MNNRIAVISGGLGDIGMAIALAFGRKGVKVALGDLAEEGQAEDTVAMMRVNGCTDVFYKKVDVTSEAEVLRWLQSVEEKWGVAQILVPNAGIVVTGALTGKSLTAADTHRQLDVNFWGSYYLAVEGAKRIKNSGLPGRIVFIGSWAAERTNARLSAYCISKAAVRMLCKSMALELAADQILVNEVAPGIVAGGLSKKNQQRDPELLKDHLNAIPAAQLVSVEEVAHHVLSLADFSVSNITGTTLTVDGGISLTSRMTR